ncbi:tripartite motif-containing protein 54 [Nothobranchius furzeri]|uniref:RING-type E3 ubiquitin transferase n=2 Tax=Nothobranchius furzeri TaxID=105023 RepID=A0A8C6MGJ7_NOTFU|nr:tripartite motif-containing protein 54 [Nothobranchius furzeri]
MSLSSDLSFLQRSHGAEREAELTKLEKQLICPLCQDIFNKPVVILPCQHNLCRKCANELYQPSLFHARTTMLVNSGHFRCPSCRREVLLDRHGVYGLQRNLLVESIIDVYKQEINNAPSLLPPPPLSLPHVTCSHHEGEKLNIYCLTCQIPTCSLCKVFGTHESCHVAPLAEVYQQQKEVLSEGVTSLMGFSDRVQMLISELEESCRNIQENYKTQKQKVCDTFDHMVSILEEKQKVMTQKISSEEEQKIGQTQMLVRCYGNSMEANGKLVESALSSMVELDMAAFVQDSGALITKMTAATCSCPSETPKPTHETLSRYSFDFSNQERALKSLSFIKVVEKNPEDLEVHSDQEEPKEPLKQSTELDQQQQEPSEHNLLAVLEPAPEKIPEQRSPPEEPVELMDQEEAPVLLDPAPDRDSWELDTPEPVSNELEPDPIRAERKEREKTHQELEAPPPVEEETIREQEGLSTQQAVTLIFYLLAFLIILQRVWAHVGCFICT